MLPDSSQDMLESRVTRCVHCVENLAWLDSGNIFHTVHTSCYPTLQRHNSYNRTDNYRKWNAVGSPDDGHKDARNMLRYYWLPINHYLLHLVGISFTYLSKRHGHSNIKFTLDVFIGSMYILTGSLLFVIYHMACKWLSSQVVNVLLVGVLFPFPCFSGGCVFLFVGCVMLWLCVFVDSIPDS